MVSKTINLLGLRAKDKVTGFEGTISSVCFDLYGCVQCILTPRQDEAGKTPMSQYFDVQRLDIKPEERVMPVPDFEAQAAEPSAYGHGAAEKPALNSTRATN
jgi:hypothetical protein